MDFKCAVCGKIFTGGMTCAVCLAFLCSEECSKTHHALSEGHGETVSVPSFGIKIRESDIREIFAEHNVPFTSENVKLLFKGEMARQLHQTLRSVCKTNISNFVYELLVEEEAE